MVDRGIAQLTPTTAERSFFDVAGHRLAALDAHPVGDGRGTLLLLPGITGSKEDFAPILDPLAAQGIRCVAIDQLGQYESPGTGAEQDYQPDALGRLTGTLISALDSASGPVVLLGHSYGGLVARATVLTGARPAGLILLDTGPHALSSPASHADLEAADQLLRTSGAAATFELRQQADVAAGLRFAPELVEFYRTRFLATDVANLLGMGRALLTEPDRSVQLAEALRENNIPVAVICGRDELAWPLPEQQAMADALDTDLVIIENAGHSPAVEAPAALVQFLTALFDEWLPVR